MPFRDEKVRKSETVVVAFILCIVTCKTEETKLLHNVAFYAHDVTGVVSEQIPKIVALCVDANV